MTQKFDFSINQGTDSTLILSCADAEGNAADFSGCRAAMQLRSTYGAEPADTLSTENERLSFSGSTLTIKFTHKITESFSKREYLYDVKIETPGGERYRIVEGTISVSRGVTHDVL